MGNEGVTTKDKSSEVYLCPNCGANMIFNIKSQNLKCPYCEMEFDKDDEENRKIREYDLDDGFNEDSLPSWGEETTTIECKSCGGEIVIGKNETATSCGFCGSSHVFPSKQTAGIKPEGVLPFKIEEYMAKESLQKWMKRRWLAPNDLKNIYSSEKMKAIYVPYWTFDAQTNSYYRGKGGKNYYVTEEVDGKKVKRKKTDWYNVSGNVNKFFDDIQVNASKNFSEKIIDKIEPFDMNQLVSYNPKYLSGYMAERYTKGIQMCFDIAKDEMNREIREQARRQILKRYDEALVISVNTNYSKCKYKHILLPVWTAQYSYKGKKYVYIINGQNGKISGSFPYSYVKIAFLIILAILLVCIFIYIKKM